MSETASLSQKTTHLLRVLLVHQSDHGAIQFVRYGFTAFISFIVDIGLLYVFTSKFHIFYLLSSTASFAISTVANYALSTAWVFTRRNQQQRSKQITYFFVICLIALGLNDVFIWLFTSVAGMYYLTSKLITVTIVFFWSFGARRFLFNSLKLQAAAVEEDEA